MQKIIEFIASNLNNIGFVVTLIGTIIGIIALIMTLKINTKTNQIQKNIKLFEVKANFKHTRDMVLRSMHTVRGKYRETGEYRIFEIREVLIELEEYRDLYSMNFIESLDDFKKELNKEYKGNKIPKSTMDNIMNIIYRIQKKLENNTNVLKEEVGVEGL